MKNRILSLSAMALLFGGASSFADTVTTLIAVETLATSSTLILPTDTAPAPVPRTCGSSARSVCTNSTDSYSFAGCSTNNGKMILNGSFDEVFTGLNASNCTSPLINGESMTRSFKGLTATYASGQSVTGDTYGGVAYDGTIIPSIGLSSSRANGILTVTNHGYHLVVKGADGSVSGEAYAISSAPVEITGQSGDGSLVINDGSSRIYHQLEKYTSDVNTSKVAWSDATCCHPVSGSITEVMSGSKTGTNALTFSSICGTARIVRANGTTALVSLPAC
jgi:hypothetical protein